MMNLAPDSHRGPVFLVGPDGQRGPTALTCCFVGFRTDFVTSVSLIWLVPTEFWPAGVFAPPRGRENPKGVHPLRPLGYVPEFCTVKLFAGRLHPW